MKYTIIFFFLVSALSGLGQIDSTGSRNPYVFIGATSQIHLGESLGFRQPGGGLYLGLGIKKEHQKWGWKADFLVEGRIGPNQEYTLTTPDGVMVGETSLRPYESQLRLTSIVFLKKDLIRIGTGIQASYLLLSNLRWGSNVLSPMQNEFSSLQYIKPLLPNIPIEIGLDAFGAGVEIRYEVSLVNQIRGDVVRSWPHNFRIGFYWEL